jgi:hypothetical protein
VESLEDRCVPAVTFSVNGTHLNIIGDQSGNTVQITDDGTSGANAIKVVADGVTQFFSGTIDKINVDTHQGNDSVSYELTGDLQAGLTRYLEAHLQQGSDTFQATVDGNLLAGSTLHFRVKGNQGKDVLSVDAAGVDIARDALFQMYLDGDQGKDSVSVNYSGQVLGHFKLIAEGENGKDTVGADLTFDDGSTGTANAQVSGGNGKDNLTLLAQGAGVADLLALNHLHLSLDGGNGKDTCTATSGIVTVTNCP